jgi:lipopolysaccharide export LptBFGC system permease protein LptF
LIVQRYLIREILHYFFAVFSVLLVVAMTIAFVRLLAEMSMSAFSSAFVLLLGMLAVPLARTLPRQGKYTKLAMGIAVYFLYGNAVGLMQTFIERGQVSTMIGIWPVHIAMALVVVSLLYVQSSGRAPTLRKRNREVRQA